MTYLQHFALTRYPFQTPAETDELFPAQAGIETQTRLQHLLELRGIGLLTGEVGCGKTTACRQFAASLHPGLFRVAYVALTTGSVLDMYQTLAWELGLQPERSRAPAFRALREEIARLAREAHQLPVLIIDEAHNLRNDVLEELRLLTSFQMDAERCLCLLLSGLSSLRKRLAMAVHESLGQRIAVQHQLSGLARDELEPYLAHRLHLAGCDLPLFDPNALEALFQASRGLPRQVDRIAHFALAAAACAQARQVSAEQLEQACAEVRL